MSDVTFPDGARFALLMSGSADVVFAETRSGITDLVVAGHGEADSDEDRVGLRSDFLAELAAHVQGAVLSSVGTGGLDEDALTVLLHDRATDVVELEEWDSNVPLLLMATGYAPYTDVPAPVGDTILWLDPATETTFLDSLARAGVAELLVRPM